LDDSQSCDPALRDLLPTGCVEDYAPLRRGPGPVLRVSVDHELRPAVSLVPVRAQIEAVLHSLVLAGLADLVQPSRDRPDVLLLLLVWIVLPLALSGISDTDLLAVESQPAGLLRVHELLVVGASGDHGQQHGDQSDCAKHEGTS